MSNNVLEKEAVLTTIPEKQLRKLSDIQEYIINDMVATSLMNKDTTTEADIGIGTLLIRCEDNELKIKFKPSAKFEESLKETILNGQNTLKLVLEKTLVEKIMYVYKDLI